MERFGDGLMPATVCKISHCRAVQTPAAADGRSASANLQDNGSSLAGAMVLRARRRGAELPAAAPSG